MILSNVSTLCAFPNEKIGIFLVNTADPISDASVTFNITNNIYANGDDLVMWQSAPTFKQSGAETLVLSSELLSSYYDSDKTDTYILSTYNLDIPNDFPLFIDSSTLLNHSIQLELNGGLSSITIYPSRILPLITDNSDYDNDEIYKYTLSATLLPLTAFSDDIITKSQYLKNLDMSLLTYLDPSILDISSISAYSNSHKKDYVWSTTKNATRTLGNKNGLIGSKILANKPELYIIPESFSITFPLSSKTTGEIYKYSANVAKTTSANNYQLSGFNIDGETPFSSTNKPSLYKTSTSWNAYISLNTNFIVPANSPITVSYDTSATVLTSTDFYWSKISNDTLALSTRMPLYEYLFNIPLSGTTSGTNTQIKLLYTPEISIDQTTNDSLLNITLYDNCYNSFFPLSSNRTHWQGKINEIYNDYSLSAKINDVIYQVGEWFTISENPIYLINDESANAYSINLDLTNINGANYKTNTSRFVLNKERALISIDTLSSTDYSVILEGTILPEYISSDQISWNVFPSNNIIAYEWINGARGEQIELDTLIDANDVSVELINLGIDQTKITLYSSLYGASALTYWFPSSGVYQDLSLKVDGSLISNTLNPFAQLSAFVVKNGMTYPVPETGNIIWNENNNQTVDFISSANNSFVENNTYPSTQEYTTINPKLYSTKTTEKDNNTSFNFFANVIDENYNLTSNKIISVPTFPSGANVYATLSASTGKIINTKETESLFFTTSATISALANIGDFSSFNSIHWKLPNGDISIGESIIYDLTSSACLGISAFSAIPSTGNFDSFDFVDEICLYVLGAEPPTLDFKAIPQYKFHPTKLLSFSDNSYTSSNGLRFLRSCDTQNFLISTFSGFDKYYYKIGNSPILSSTSNIETITLNKTDIGTSAVYISAFNEIFVETDPVTVYNSCSSIASNKYNGFVSYLSPQTITPILTIDKQIYNVEIDSLKTIDLNVAFTSNNYDALSTNFVFVLSTYDGIKKSNVISFEGNTYDLSTKFSYVSSDFFGIPYDSFVPMNLYVSGYFIKSPKNYDGCSSIQTFNTISNKTSLSATSGPFPNIFRTSNIGETNEVIEYINESSFAFSEFLFEDGNNHYQRTYNTSTTLTGQYTSIGFYTPSLTGYFNDNRQPIITEFPYFILIKDVFEEYDPSVVRSLYSELTLPYSLEDVKIKENSWQTAKTLNDSINKIKTNIEFLSANCYAYDSNFPKNLIGWQENKYNKQKWYYTSHSTNNTYDYSYFSDIFVNDRIYKIENDKIIISENDFTNTLILSSDHITTGETFKNLKQIVYNNELNKIIVLDSDYIYVFDNDNDTELKLTHYWGGNGDSSISTSLNSPVDLTIDHDNNLYVTCKSSKLIKIYNAYLNLYKTITLTETPTSCDSNDSYIFVLTESNKLIKFDKNTLEELNSYDFTGNLVRANKDSQGLLYILTNSAIVVITEDGKQINSYEEYLTGLSFYNNEIYGIRKTSIVKLIDYIEKLTTFSNTWIASSFNWDSIFIDKYEAISPVALNDSFKKIHDNLVIFANDLKLKFTTQVDPYYNVLSHSMDTMTTAERLLTDDSFVPLGINEIVGYETINRYIENIFVDLDKLKTMVDVRKDYNYNICWTWKKHKINVAQNTSKRINPFSWYELRDDKKANSYLLSAITWENATSCQEENNPFPLCNNWISLGCKCINPTHWTHWYCGSSTITNWNSLTSDCCTHATKFFDDCISIC